MSEMMKVRESYRMEEWLQIIQRCQASGLSIKKYCNENCISERQYHYWKNKIRISLTEECSPTLYRVDLCEKRTTNRSDGAGVILVRFHDAEIELDGHDVESVTVVLRALKNL